MPGKGEIVRMNKDSAFINLQNNNRYYSTSQSDSKCTVLPAIPWLESILDDRRIGQLIHLTTNLEALEKASSNLYMGLRELYAWWA